jgi:uncharacterized protein (TIGR02145 family)
MKNLNNSLGIILTILIFSSCKEKPGPPILSTTPVTSITATSAVSGGNVTDDGGSAIISRGVCWNTLDKPETTNNKTSDSGSSGTFISNLTQLTPNTNYFIRAYATNSVGTSYGSSVSFKTLGDKPAITAAYTTELQVNTAKLFGSINPNSLTTIVTFEYGLTTSYGSNAIPPQNTLSGDSNLDVTVTLTSLNPGKIYHYRIKAENSLGTTYSSDIIFTTLGLVPSITSLSASNISLSSASLNCLVNPNDLPTTVTAEYGSDINYGNIIEVIQGAITGNSYFSLSYVLNGLPQLSVVHFRFKAVNQLGITTSADISFSTIGVISDLDGNYYQTVLIGNQGWMTKNLKTTKYNDGTAIPNVTVGTTWGALTTGAYMDYSNDPLNSAIYGKLYNWFVVDNNASTKMASNGGKNVCPTGWHVPSDAEWTTLTNYLGGEDIAGGKLKETGLTHWKDLNTGATNETGFSALPGGYTYYDGTCLGIGYSGHWWSSTEYPTAAGWSRYMSYSYTKVFRTYHNKQYGRSVRCVRDL